MTCTELIPVSPPLSFLSITAFVQENTRVNKFVLSPPVCTLLIQPEVLKLGKTTPGNGRKLTWPLHCPVPCHFLPVSFDWPRGRQGEDVQRQTQGESEDKKRKGGEM